MAQSPAFSRRYVIVLAIIAATILIVGATLRPRHENGAAAQTSGEADLARLTLLAQRRSLESTTAYFAAVASGAASGIGRLTDLDTSGVALSASVIVAARTAAPWPDAVTFQLSDSHRAETVRARPDEPFVVVSPNPRLALKPAPRSGITPLAGHWVLGLWRDTTGPTFVPGQIISTDSGRCGELPVRRLMTSIALTPGMAGAAILDIDGGLLAIVLPCAADRMSAILVDSLDAAIGSGSTAADRLLTRLGIVVAVPTAGESAYFEATGGLIVRDLWVDYPAARAGLRPGDVVEAINGEPITGPEDLDAAWQPPNSALTLAVRRARVTREIAIGGQHAPPGPALPAADRGLVWTADSGVAVDGVAEHSPAFLAGVRPGDRVMQIDGRAPRDGAELRRLLAARRSRPVFLDVARGPRRFGSLLP
ncbi:MAG: PDZ domain-containing protein [Acidobacteriota bacterium]